MSKDGKVRIVSRKDRLVYVEDLHERNWAGETQKTLAREIGVNANTIRSSFRRYGLKGRPDLRGRQIDVDKMQAVIDGLRAGKTRQQIAHEQGVTKQAISERIQKLADG